MAGGQYTTPQVSFAFPTNSGGLNSTASPLTVADNEATDLQNIDFDVFGSFKKRKGYDTLNSSAFNSGAVWNGLHWFETVSGTDYLVGVCGNKFAKMDDLDGTWDDVTGTITLTAGAANLVCFRTFLDTVIATNGIDAPFKWTGSGNASAWTMPTGLTKAKFCEVFTGYTFVANCTVSGTDHPTRIYWSDINTIETWDSADFNDVSRNDGQAITGLQTLGDKLVIFKERSIHVAIFTGDPDIPFVFIKTPSNVGCVSGFSIQEVNNGLIFLANDGFYFFDGTNSFKISDRIDRTLREEMAKSRFQYASSGFQRTKNRYWCCLSSGGTSTNDKVITFDSVNNAFSVYDGINSNALEIVYTNGEERIYFGDYSGYVYQADTGNNDNPEGVETAIDAYFKTKWFNFGDVAIQKAVPHLYIYHTIDNATITLGYSFDFEAVNQYTRSVNFATSAAVYGTAIYGTSMYAGTGGGVKRVDLTGRGRVVRFSFENDTLDETFRVDGFGMIAHGETHA